MKKIKCFRYILISFLISILLVGCDEVQIFKTNTDPTALVPLSNSELIDNSYYVKNGTKFFLTYAPTGSAKDDVNELDESRVLPVVDNATLIPPYYKSEILAYYSERGSIDGVVLERFQSLGYSISVYNAKLTDQGVEFNFNSNVPKSSSLFKAIGKPQSPDLVISAINGEKIEQANFNSAAGVIVGLEKGKTYTVSYFEGTKYKEVEVVADTLMLQAFELYGENKDLNRTSNGYVEFSMPTDYKSGYYVANGKGLFQYYAYKRGEKVDSEEDMNVSYFETELDKLAAYSRQYTVQIPNRVRNLKIYTDYSGDVYDDTVVKGYIFSPSGEKYNMDVDTDNKTISATFAEAGAGTWTVNIVPKSLNISNISVDKDEFERSLTLKETNVEFDEDTENVLFSVEYKNKDAEVNGVITSASGDTWTMKKEEIKEGGNSRDYKYYLRYNASFVPQGTYSVKIYYDVTSTEIGEVETSSTSNQDTEVFVIEE